MAIVSIFSSADDFRRNSATTSLNFMKGEATTSYNNTMTSTAISTASETYCPPWPMAHSQALDLKVEAEELMKKDTENLDHKTGL